MNNRANGALAIYEESFFSKIGNTLGMQDIEIGDEEIDKRSIISSALLGCGACLLAVWYAMVCDNFL